MKRKLVVMACIIVYQASSAQTGKSFTLTDTKLLYDSLYRTSVMDSIDWNGDTETCKSGTIQKEVYRRAEDRINFFRLMIGLNKVSINHKFNAEAQCAALIVKANNQLTHYPTADMNCYSALGNNGSRKSCLAKTDFKHFGESNFITHFIKDYGSTNNAVGHRRWLLYSKLISFGYGATDRSEAILTVDGVSHDTGQVPPFIAYPWNGFVPYHLIFNKWSFSLPEQSGADFNSATVSMFDDNENKIPIMKLLERKDFLDPTIVWTVPQLMSTEDEKLNQNKIKQKGYLDKKIKVKITGVKVNGALKNYEYFVVPVEM